MSSHPARRADQQVRAIGVLAQAVLDGDDVEVLLGRIATEARELAGATASLVATIAGQPEMLTVRAASGVSSGPAQPGFTTPLAGTFAEQLVRSGSMVVAPDAESVPPAGRAFLDYYGFGPTIVVPLATIGAARGVLGVAKLAASAPFRRSDATLIATFAAQAAAAIELGELRAIEVAAARTDERTRIARDLHDGVVQTLFGVGIGLRALIARPVDATLRPALEDALERIDRAISIIRDYIAGLRSGASLGAPSADGPASFPASMDADGAELARQGLLSRDPVAAIGRLARRSMQHGASEDLLTELLQRACETVGGFGIVGTLTEDGEHCLIRARTGPDIPHRRVGLAVPIEQTYAGDAIRSGRPIIVPPRPSPPPAISALVGSVIALPLLVRGRAFGAMAIARPVDARPPTKAQLARLEAYAAQAAIALEFDRVRTELRSLAVSAERERIARELHEQVIQMLYSVGLSLQSLEVSAAHPDSRSTLRSAVDDLDRAMRDLRRYVFGLGPSVMIERTFHAEIERLALELIQPSGIELEMAIDPAVSPLVADAAPHLVQVVREALSNVARHSRARHCRLRVQHVDGSVVIDISDDGRGPRDRQGPHRRSRGSGRGLENMRARVMEIGGAIDIAGPGQKGMRVLVTVPGAPEAAVAVPSRQGRDSSDT